MVSLIWIKNDILSHRFACSMFRNMILQRQTSTGFHGMQDLSMCQGKRQNRRVEEREKKYAPFQSYNAIDRRVCVGCRRNESCC